MFNWSSLFEDWFCRTTSDNPSLGRVLHANHLLNPTRPALVEIDSDAFTATGKIVVLNRCTYLELEYIVEKCCDLLREDYKLSSTDVVACVGSASISQSAFLLSSLRTGIITVPVNPFLPIEELAEILTNCQPDLIFSESQFCEKVREAISLSPTRVAPKCEELPKVVVPDNLDKHSFKYTQSFEDEVSNDMPLSILYSSGTTGGEKKGVLVDQRLIKEWQVHVAVGLGSHIGIWPHYGMGGYAGFFNAISSRQTFYLLRIQNKMPPIVTFCHLIHMSLHKFNIEWVWCAPLHLELPMHLLRDKFTPPPGLKFACLGGTWASGSEIREINDRYAETDIMVVYGSTEIGAGAWNHIGSFPGKAHTVGKPLKGVTISASGEILKAASEPSVFTGYYNNSDLTSSCFTEDRLYCKTGDLGEIDADGFLVIKGRVDDMIILSVGQNLLPSVLENKLLEHSSIQHATVLGVKVADKHKLVAVIVKSVNEADDQTFSNELKAYLKAKNVSSAMCPEEFLYLEQSGIPLTASGKVKRRILEGVVKEKLLK